MHTSARGLRLIEDFEGFSPVPYNDGTGVMTIGYGTTAADVDPLPRELTREQAQELLQRKLADKYEPAVNALGVPLNQNQFDALVSLAYNVGPGVFDWQIGRDLRARRYADASEDFLHYVYAGGRELDGLVNRRRAERALFDTPVSIVRKTIHKIKHPGKAKSHRKVVGGVTGGGLGIAILHILAGAGVHITPTEAAAISTLSGFIVAYLTPAKT